ncbi:FAD-dependent oxidoreductase [Paraburkholderia caribensis]|jgi:thioredoxin reductase (NADPH)|uniref:FAD-dependent oxidoreductase n=1 Tax=Paraburkholderia caribensis TaxID=75105 RepID=UPI001CB4B3B1|nr:FAD-dependent oxidoreductase [Paraburkholderia caribensis]CAG9261521.1 Thioredoxin reductase [Paraburkholderia caribensis]
MSTPAINPPALLSTQPDAGAPDLAMPYSSLEFRQHQMFPRLSAAQIASLRRFAQPMSFKAGELIFETGRIALGLFVLLHGRVRICSRDSLGRSTLVTEHDDGHFMAEMAQLSGKPALIDGIALTDCETLMVSPDKLRALIVADAQLGEHIMRALILRRLGLIEQGLGPIIVGNGDDARLIRLQGFLRRNAYPAMVIDARHDADAATLLAGITTGPDDFPLVFCPNGSVLRAPDEAQLASCLGLVPTFERSHIYDVAIVGAGPAGLAAAVYAATEGLSVAVFDQRAPGGQAGASSRIENYLGFPTGISGQALAARAFQQALKFGAHLAIPGKVTCVDSEDGIHGLTLLDGQRVNARTVVVASGAAYRKPGVAGFDRYEGSGIYYWASPIEAKLVKGQDIVLIGGGNSAGQATVFLANFARSIRVLIRGADLNASMSKYLIDRIGSLPNVSVCTRCTLQALDGDEAGLTHVHVRREDEGDETIETRHLFLFIGADPKTDWLMSSGVELDSHGFVVTGFARRSQTHGGTGIHYPLETSLPGMFAVGDVRSESTKRVASAVGDGAAVVSQIHAYLAHCHAAAQNI